MQDLARASGELRITLFDSATGVLRELDTRNKIMDAGLIWFVQSIGRLVNTGIANMAIGTNTQPAAGTDQGLYNEVAIASTSTNPSGASFVINATFGEGSGTGDISEFGLFLSDGTLIARSVIPAQTKSATTTMQVQWTITLQSA